MSIRLNLVSPARQTLSLALLSAVAWLGLSPLAAAQQNGGTVGFIAQPVGGVLVDTNGVLANAEVDALGGLQRLRNELMQELPGDLRAPSPLRKVSLRRLEEAIDEAMQTGEPLPDEMQFLAGLTRIQYVLVYPEQNDIVLAGPAEGWHVDAAGNVVGSASGRPVMQLEDLLVALRSAEGAARTSISCSIDPTNEGLVRLRGFLQQQRQIGPDPRATIAAIEQTLGPQTISVTGVPADSHFARVMVAADYRMKRLAMDFEASPVPGLPSYLQMVRGGSANMLPRWWLAPNYEPMLKDPQGLTWELRGSSVKAMTEEDAVSADGARQQTGRANPIAQRWADNMTARYEELALELPIFAELRNVMDLAVVGALIVKERLNDKAGCPLPLLLDPQVVEVTSYHVPQQVDSKASFVKKGRNYIISASGGVQIHSWGIADRVEVGESLAPVRDTAQNAAADRWWWD